MLLLPMAVSCRKPAPPSDATTAPGAPHNLAALGQFPAPSRVVSLAPALTELVYALGAGDRLVGVTRFCDFPAEARALPKIGGFLDPSVEAILAARPELVLVATNSGTEAIVRRLEAEGLRVLWLRLDGLNDVRTGLEVVAEALGRPEVGRTLRTALDRRIASVTARIPHGARRPRTLVVVGHRPLIVAGPGTWLDELVTLAGGQNAAADANRPYPQWSAEVLLERRPEVILDVSMGGETDLARAELDRWRALTAIPAVRDHRIHSVPDDRLLRPGPRVADALELLVRLLGPTP